MKVKFSRDLVEFNRNLKLNFSQDFEAEERSKNDVIVIIPKSSPFGESTEPLGPFFLRRCFC